MSPIAYKEGGRAPRAKEVPPYNGFGSEEDSLCSCQGLMPSPPRRDFIKFMEKVRSFSVFILVLVHVDVHVHNVNINAPF